MRRALGAMTGTSIDALDLALIHVEGEGLGARPTFIRGWSFPLGDLASLTRSLATGAALLGQDIAALAHALAELHARAITSIRSEVGGLDLVAVHGQTVFHRPPVSWQLLNPWPIARAAACPVVFDMRGADLAAGGQGAPITPVSDWIFFRDPKRPRAIINLGGFCNITILPPGGPDGIRGFDVCACNQILDAVARYALNVPYDDGGASALSGTPDAVALSELRAALEAQRGEKRSLGTGDEAMGWVHRWLGRLAPRDLAASAAAAIGTVIGVAAGSGNEIVLAGGGVRNAALVRAIGGGGAPRTTDDLGVPAPFREAAAMAILGVLCADGTPITLPHVTGVPSPAPVSGAWVFPSGPCKTFPTLPIARTS